MRVELSVGSTPVQEPEATAGGGDWNRDTTGLGI